MTESDENWWEREEVEKPKLTTEELLSRLERLEVIQKNIPKGLLFKQFLALIYVVVNAIFLYANIRSRYIGYVAIYMIPITVILLDYFLAIGSLKKIAKGG